MDAATRRQGLSSLQIPLPAPEGGPRGAPPRPNTSMIIMRPPQQGHGGRCSGAAPGSAVSCAAAGAPSGHVEQEAPDELVGGEGHCAISRLPVAAVILVPEGHAALVERNEPAVRDGDAVGVA